MQEMDDLTTATNELVAVADTLYSQVERDVLEAHGRCVVNVQNHGDSHAAIAVRIADVNGTGYYVGLKAYQGTLFRDAPETQFEIVNPEQLGSSTLRAIIPQLKAKANKLLELLQEVTAPAA